MEILKEPSAEYVLDLPMPALAQRKALGVPPPDGDLRQLRAPAGFAWLMRLDAEEQIEFFSSLLGALFKAQQSGDWSVVNELIEDWQATANVYADPATMRSLEMARQERASGAVTSLRTLRQELEL
jgi:hypothetical protein